MAGFITTPQPLQMNAPQTGERLKNLKDMQIGAGATQFNAGRDGIFLGADNFADAPFSVDMEGNILVKKANGAGVKVSGEDNNIVVNDGTNDRVLIGYLAGKF